MDDRLLAGNVERLAPVYQPMLRVALALAAGIIASRIFAPPVAFWCVAAAASGIVWLASFRAGRLVVSSTCLLLMIGAAGGLWHHWNWNYIEARDVGRFSSERAMPAYVRGVISSHPNFVAADLPSRGDANVRPGRTRFTLDVESIRDGIKMVHASGRIEVFVNGRFDEFPAGERVDLAGSLSTISAPGNPGQFDLASHFRGQGVHCWMNIARTEAIMPAPDRPSLWHRPPGIIKARLDAMIWRFVGEDRAALASAMLLGNRGQLDQIEREQFMLTGTVHLLAISGLHVGILAGLFLALPRTGLASRRMSLLLTFVFVVSYAWLVEFRPPVARAAILISVYCYCKWVGRDAFSFNSLAMAALIVMIANPSDLFSVGAQLSFLAVGSLIFAWRWLARPVSDDPIDRLIVRTRSWQSRAIRSVGRKILAATMVSTVIWLAALPLVAARFHVVTPIALIINPLVLFPMTLALVSGLAVMVLGWIPPLGFLAGWVCNQSLTVMKWLIETSESIPWSYYWTPGPPLASVVVFYAILLMLFVVRPRGVPWPAAAGLLGAWMAIGWGVPAHLTQRAAEQRTTLACTFIDVGHGSCILLELPGGANVLYDCGSMGSPRAAARNASDVLWSRGISRLDAAIISHADADHFNGFPELSHRFPIDRLIISSVMASELANPKIGELVESLRASGIGLVELVATGDELNLAAGVRVDVLNPPRDSRIGSDNANSIVLDIGYRDRRILLTGDLVDEGLESLLRRAAVNYDVVMAPHHGSPSSRPAGTVLADAYTNWSASIFTEFALKPFQHCPLIVDGRAADCCQQVERIRLGWRSILEALIAGRTNRAQVARFVTAAFRLVQNMPHYEPYRSGAAQRVRIARSNPAHLAGIPVAFQNLGANFLRYSTLEGRPPLGRFHQILIWTEVGTVFVRQNLISVFVAKLADSPGPFRCATTGRLDFPRGQDFSKIGLEELKNELF